MPASVQIPTRIRVDPDALDLRDSDIEEALLAAAGRALRNSRDTVLQARGGYAFVCVSEPSFCWGGEGLLRLPVAARAAFEQRVSGILADAVNAAGLFDWAEARSRAPEPLAGIPSERLRPESYDEAGATYEIPSYDKPAKDQKVTLEQPKGEAAKKEANKLVARLNNGDDFLFLQLLLDSRANGPASFEMDVLRKFAKANPGKFRKMLAGHLKDAAKIIGKSSSRSDTDFQAPPGTGGPFDYLDLAADAVRVAHSIPEGASVLKDRNTKTIPVDRIAALVDELIAVYIQLRDYLTKQSKETTDAGDLASLDVKIAHLPRIAAYAAAMAGEESVKSILEPLAGELLENIRWASMTLDKTQEIDSLLALYELLYGSVAGSQIEVQVLRKARSLYLTNFTRNFLPRVAKLAALTKEANDFYETWRVEAARQKLGNLKKGMDEVDKLLGGLGYTAYVGYYRPKDHEFNGELDKVKKAAADLRSDITAIESQPLDNSTLVKLNGLEAKAPEIAVKGSLLSFWRAGITVVDNAQYHDIGDEEISVPGGEAWEWTTLRGDWYKRAAAVTQEVKTQYNQPDYATLNQKMDDWKKRLESIVSEIQATAKKEFWINLGITIVAIVVTWGAGAVFGVARLGVIAVTLFEAATFTAATTIGQAVFLGKGADPSQIITGFQENFIFFGAFRLLNIGLMAGARALAPGKVLTQLGIIFGANAVVSTGIPIALSLLENGRLPEDMGTFLAINLVLNAAMALFTGPKMYKELAKLEMADTALRQAVYDQAVNIYAQLGDLAKETEELAKAGLLTEQKWTEIQGKTAKLAPDFEALLKRMAGPQFTDAALAKLGFTRAQLQEMAKLVPQYADFIAGLKYAAPAVPKGLPMPSEVAGTGLVRTGTGTFEYKPSTQQTSLIIQKLKAAGYEVIDAGGGVLQISGAKGGEPRFRALPAEIPGVPEFPQTLLERASGFRPPNERAQIQSNLNKVNSGIVKTLGAEYPDETAVAALGQLVESNAKLNTFWPLDAVRGLADMMRLEMGITRSTIRRLFADLTSAELSAFFEKCHNIVQNPNTRPIAPFLLDAEMTAARSVQLVDAIDKVRTTTNGKFEFPSDTSKQAARGLLQLALDDPTGFVDKLKDMPVDKRTGRLEALSPRKDPTRLPPSSTELLLRKLSADVRPGLSISSGTAEESVKAIEALAQKTGGKFSEPAVREDFKHMLERYRKSLAQLQAGENVERNAVGLREEIVAVLAELEKGEVFSVGAEAKVNINPNLYELPRKFQLSNAPTDIKIQLDAGAKRADGSLVLTEATSGEISLPEALKDLDPQSNVQGGSVDFSKIPDDESGRKFKQMIKTRAAAKFATDLSKAFEALSGNHASVKQPEMVVKCKKMSAPAKRVAKELGFTVIETG
jgi:hypothetical protein